MSWNYRVMRGKQNGESYYVIREVHYEDDGTINGWTTEDAEPFGETMDELINDIAWIATALAKPVLSEDDGSEVEPAFILADDLEKVVLGLARETDHTQSEPSSK